MKIRAVGLDNRKKLFEVRTSSKTFLYPYAKARPRPDSGDPVVDVSPDPEIGNEGFSFTLASGRAGTVHIEQVLEYNQDRGYLREALLYKLTLEAQRRLHESGLARREVMRRLGTSASQLYRLLDQANSRKSIDQMLALLHVLDCEVEVIVKTRVA